MDFIYLLFKTIIYLSVIVVLSRLIGKKNIKHMNYLDLLCTLLISMFIAFDIIFSKLPFLYNIVLIGALFAIKDYFVYKVISKKYGNSKALLIKNGNIKLFNMFKLNYGLNELFDNLGSVSIKDIQKAYLEEGKLIIKTNTELESIYPLPLIVDGKINYESLDRINKDKRWLESNLDVDIEDIYYGFYNYNQIYIIRKTDFIN